MRNFRISLLITLIFTFSSISSIESQTNKDWKLIGEVATGEWHYKLDTLGLVSNNIIRVWLKEIPSSERKEEHAYALKLMMFDCQNKKIRFLEVIKYRNDGTVLESLNFKKAGEDDWQEVAPESVGESLLKFFCG